MLVRASHLQANLFIGSSNTLIRTSFAGWQTRRRTASPCRRSVLGVMRSGKRSRKSSESMGHACNAPSSAGDEEEKYATQSGVHWSAIGKPAAGPGQRHSVPVAPGRQRPPPPTRSHARPARLEERIIIFISNERAMIIVSYRTSINY